MKTENLFFAYVFYVKDIIDGIPQVECSGLTVVYKKKILNKIRYIPLETKKKYKIETFSNLYNLKVSESFITLDQLIPFDVIALHLNQKTTHNVKKKQLLKQALEMKNKIKI